MTRRLLLDVSSLMYRAHFALPEQMVSPEGRRIGAIHGYLDMVVRLLVARRPGEAIHVYDHDWRPLARTEIYPGYKAQRPPEPEELTWQFERLREVLGPTGMRQAQAVDWEAEDAIGGICRDAAAEDRIEIVSGDRDLIQLVRDPKVLLLSTVRGVSNLLELDEAAVQEKYGVSAARYGDFAILRGDPSDGLPGVQGVGEKTARALTEAYPSLDALLEDAEREQPTTKPVAGSPKLRARLREAAGYIAAMRRIVPINADAHQSIWAGERDDRAALVLADRHGLRGPIQRLLAALDST